MRYEGWGERNEVIAKRRHIGCVFLRWVHGFGAGEAVG